MEKIFTVWLKNNENVKFSIEAKSQREAKQKVASYNCLPISMLKAKSLDEEECPIKECKSDCIPSVEEKAMSFAEKLTLELQELPEELRGVVSYMAYERSHSGGEEEVFGTVLGLVSDLKDAVKAYGDRRFEDGKAFEVMNHDW